MNKRKRKTASRFPLPVIALGFVLVIAAAVFGLSRNSGGGTPKLAVDPQDINYGDVKLDTELTFEIKVKNEGDGTLRFREQPSIQVVEGCWPPELTISSMVIQPGETAVVRSSVFMMHQGMDGPHNFAVHLVTNDPQQPDRVVNVISNWIP